MTLFTGVLALGLAVVHLVAGRLRFLEGIPRSRWLSLAGGVSIAYVFIHVFPELASAQETLRRAAGASLAFLEHHAYLVALAGLVIFYGLERVVKTAQRRRQQQPDAGEGETTTGMGVFWLHIGSFAVYNALVGYLLLHREQQNWQGLLFFFLAMLFHFVVNDYGLRQDHKDTYHRYGRWLLAAAVLFGWAVGLVTQAGEALTALLFAFLAGGVILNILKEELPEERRSRFLPFLIGAALYAALLLII